MKNKKTGNEHKWRFSQAGSLVQVQLSTIDDVLNLDKLDPKLWTALACPVKGLEFSEETLSILDLDHNGRVRVPEIIEAVKYIKKYFAKPEVIMTPGDTIPIDALSETPFDCGHSPLDSAKYILQILEKPEATELSLGDVSVNEKLFSPGIINGDGVLPAECVKEENIAAIVKDIIDCTGGTDDISGVKGINRGQLEEFYNLIRSIKEWKEDTVQNDPKIFFLKEATDSAATAYMKVKDKINDYYLRCALINYDEDAQEILKNQINSMFLDADGNLQDIEHLSELPLASCAAGKPLPLDEYINPAWTEAIETFKKNTILPIFNKEIASLTETNWRKIEALFEPYVNWVKSMPENSTSGLGLDRICEILNSDAEEKISEYLSEEEKHPPIALATIDLRKMLLLRRDLLSLLRNFVSFDYLYNPELKAIFQCGTLYIDGRSCDLCFKVLDIAKHGIMASLSQCFLVYCDCTKAGTAEKMQIAALISNGKTDNIIVGRNGIFFDNDGNDWDATIVKIIENPISVKQAFWSPYKKLVKTIQEKISAFAANAENNVMSKMSNPGAAAATPNKKIEIGTIAAISVAFTGIATVVGGLLQAFLGLGYWIPLGIIGIILAISLPSMFIAWSKLKQRNIAPILDASGWAINGNVKITPALGNTLTNMAKRPLGAYISSKDPYAYKKAPVKRIILCIILILIIVGLICGQIYYKSDVNGNGIPGLWKALSSWCSATIAKLKK